MILRDGYRWPLVFPNYYSVVRLPDNYNIYGFCSADKAIRVLAYSNVAENDFALIEYNIVDASWITVQASEKPPSCNPSANRNSLKVVSGTIEEYSDDTLIRRLRPKVGSLKRAMYHNDQIITLSERGRFYVSTDMVNWVPISKELSAYNAVLLYDVSEDSLLFLGNKLGNGIETLTNEYGNIIISYGAYSLYEYDFNTDEIKEILKLSEDSGNIQEVIRLQDAIIIITSTMYYQIDDGDLLAIPLPRNVHFIWSYAVDLKTGTIYLTTNNGIIYRPLHPD